MRRDHAARRELDNPNLAITDVRRPERADVDKVLLLYDEITQASAKEFVRELTKLSPTAEVTIAINSPGGSVPAGDAIAAVIDRHKGTTTCRIDGVAASAASYIAMFASRIVMARGSFLMVHCPWATMAGTADDLESTVGTLRAIEARPRPAPACPPADSGSRRSTRARRTWRLFSDPAVEVGHEMIPEIARVAAGTIDERGLASPEEQAHHSVTYMPGAATTPPSWRICPLRSGTGTSSHA